MSNNRNYRLIKRTQHAALYGTLTTFAVIYSDGLTATFDTINAALAAIN